METVNKKRVRQDKKNAARRQYRQDAREALFIHAYIKEKYPEVYEEAGTFYNYINKRYPQKRDLRKTDEFNALKLGFTFVVKEQNKPLAQVYQSIDLAEGNYTVVAHMPPGTATEEPEQPATEQAATEQAATEEPEQVATEQAATEQAATEEPEQPATEQAATEQAATEQAATEEPEQVATEQAATEQAATEEPEQVATEQAATEQAATEEPEQVATEQAATEQAALEQPKQTKIFELKIPLMSAGLSTKTQGIQENPLAAACRETLQEIDEPILADEIPQAVYESILADLQGDPYLSDIMNDIELEFDMEVDLPLEDDRLEQELYNLW